MSSVDITVALPTYDNKNILWLQLESLCEQKTQYSWELIVCEEPSKNYSGKSYVMKYEDRLKSAGCVKVSYIGIDNHIPLSRKWVTIAQHSCGNAFVFAAADNYSPPDRLEVSYTHILNGYNWVDVYSGLFLDLKNWNKATNRTKPGRTGLFMCTKPEYIKKLTGPWPKKNIDNWIRRQQKIEPRFMIKGPVLGLHTNGANKISKERHKVLKNIGKLYPKIWVPPEQILEEIIPDHIIKRLSKVFLK